MSLDRAISQVRVDRDRSGSRQLVPSRFAVLNPGSVNVTIRARPEIDDLYATGVVGDDRPRLSISAELEASTSRRTAPTYL